MTVARQALLSPGPLSLCLLPSQSRFIKAGGAESKGRTQAPAGQVKKALFVSAAALHTYQH